MLVTRRFTALNVTALLIGVLAGLAAVVFRRVIQAIEAVAFQGSLEFTARGEDHFFVSRWGLLVFLVPVAGGLVVGVIRRIFPEIRRQGVPDVMAAVQTRGGIIRGRTSWGHALVSAVTVGTGGSTGREGPIGYIGAALGSSIGRRLGFRPRDIKVLLGCGIAAGIAATFNAPLGGVLFAIELILPEFSTHAFIPVVLAVVLAVTIATQDPPFFLGDQPGFQVPEFTLQSPWELAVYLALGVVCGLGGVGFIRLMGWATDRGDRFPIPYWVKPAVGGLLVGLLGLMVFEATGAFSWLGGTSHYHIFGTGYATVNAVLQGETFMLAAPLLVLLLVLKPIAASITIGSGGGGGVFSASLWQGALYGALVGLAANALFPGAVGPVPAYALVGMGAFYAATGRATLTTIVLMTELTSGYAIVLPVMFAAVTADAVSIGLSRDSIYTVRLTKRGILFDHDRMQSPLDFLQVKDVMTREIDSLKGSLDVGSAFNRMLDLGHTGYPVVDEGGALLGVVTRRDLSKHMHEGRGAARLDEVVSGLLITAFPDDVLHRARDRLFEEDIGRLLVVDPADRRRLVGIVTRSDVLRAEAERDIEHADAWNP